jgi:hypothetical protein
MVCCGAPPGTKRTFYECLFSVESGHAADMTTRPILTDAVEKLLDDLTKAFRPSILGVFLSRSSLPFWRC